jgi:hypothetical protein
MKSIRKYLPKLLLLFLFGLMLLLPVPACQRDSAKDILRQEASPYSFSLVGWHLKNLPAKVSSVISNTEEMPDPEERKSLLSDFFDLQAKMVMLERELTQMTSLHGNSPEIETLESRIQEKRARYEALAPQIEAIIEHEIRQILATEGIGFNLAGRRFTFPPVLFVFQKPPSLLVISPRDRIERLGDRLLSPRMNFNDIELVENRFSQYDNLSAIVVNLSGIASYPSIVSNDYDLYRSIFVVAHEWTHQYLSFYPLGRAYFDEGIGREMNETVADMVGYEVADRIHRRYGYEPPPRQPPPAQSGFNFNAEMRQTRLIVESLLGEGKIDEAERYMEERRQLFVQEGFEVRKLNQAYFAFHGTYALAPASISPVGQQLGALRGNYGTLGEFVLAVRELRTHEQLLALLDEKRTKLINYQWNV